jgi:hypothetical protein
MSRYGKLLAYFSGTVATALLSAASLVPSSPAAAAPCQGPGAPTTTQTRCIAVMTPGHPLISFDISFVSPVNHTFALAASRVVGSGGAVGTVVIGIAGPDGATWVRSYNLFGDPRNITGLVPSDQRGAETALDPKLATSLALNSTHGITETLALKAGSPAIHCARPPCWRRTESSGD